MAAKSELLGSVSGLWRYPVKSMLGEELEAALVTERGVLGDRSYAVVEPATGRVGSVKMVRKWARLFQFQAAFLQQPQPGRDLPPVRVTFPDGSTTVSGAPEMDRRLSEFFGREVTLASEPPPGLKLELTRRGEDPLDPDAPTRDFVMPNPFFDIAALHILTTASLERLRQVYPQGRFDPRRFRPNIVVQTPEGERDFVENGWVGKTLAIGEAVRIKVISPTVRCAMPTLPQGDPPTGSGQGLPRDPGIFRAAKEHNQQNVGAYGAVVRGGTVRVGDGVRVVEG